MTHLLSTALRPRPLFALFAGCAFLWLQWGCMNSHDLLDRYQAITVRGLGPETGYLSLQVRVCQPGKQRPLLFARDRVVKVPLGSEQVYFPELPSGRLQLLVRAYKTSAKRALVRVGSWSTQTYKRREPLPFLTLEAQQRDTTVRALACTPAAPPPREEPTQWTLRLAARSAKPLPDSPLSFVDPSRVVPPRETTPTLPPSPFRLGDRLSVLPSRTLKTVTGSHMVQSGSALLLLHHHNHTNAALVSLNPTTGERLGSFELPQGCLPRGLDAQGHLVAVTCAGKNRLYFFAGETLKPLEPRQGIEVGQYPIAVKLSGLFAVVVNRNSNNISVVRTDRPTATPQTLEVGETPTAVAAVGTRFFIANSDSGSVSMVDTDPATGEARKWESDLTVGRKPTYLAANGKFLVVSNVLDKTLTILPLGSGHEARTLQLSSAPARVALLSHTAIVADQQQPSAAVLDLRTFKVSQRLTFQQNLHTIRITGELVYASSARGDSLMRARFHDRRGHRIFNLGASLRQVFASRDKLWTYDAPSQRMVTLDRSTLLVKEPVLWARHANERLVWKHSSEGLAVHASVNRAREVQFRSLSAPLHIPLKIVFDQPAIAAQMSGGVVTLLHSSDSGSTASPFVTRVDLKEAMQGIRVQSSENHLSFLKKPVDLLKVEQHWWFADQQTRSLILTKTSNTTQDSGFRFLRSLPLAGTPRKLERVGDFLVVLLEDGVIQLLKLNASLNELTLRPPIKVGERLGSVLPYKQYFVFSDRKQDLLVFFDPVKETIVKRIKTGCNPDSLHAIDGHLFVSNRDDGSLSMIPLPL